MIRKIISAVLCAALAVALATATSAITKSELLETTYQFDQILFGEENVGGFTFHYYDKADSTIKDCVYVPIGESPWNPGLDMYTGPTDEDESEGYEYIIMNYTYGCPTVHPSLMGQTGCAFHCPYTGTVKITTYFRCGSVLPDASELFIYLNEVSEAARLLDYVGTETGVETEVENVEVKAGDIIYWFVDCMETTANDSCDFNPRVNYTAVNDENVSEDEQVVTDTDEQPGTDSEENSSAAPDTEPGQVTDSEKQTDKTTDKPKTTTEAGEEGQNNTWIIIGIAAAVVVIAAVVAVLIAKKKKK